MNIIPRNTISSVLGNRIRKIYWEKDGDAVNLLRSVWSDQMQYREEFVILLLNRANRVLGFTLISKGGTAGNVVDTKMIFQIALKANASGVILSHNHPSGNTAPSKADISLTKKVISGGKLMEISVQDHIILTEESQYSFADNGLMPFEQGYISIQKYKCCTQIKSRLPSKPAFRTRGGT